MTDPIGTLIWKWYGAEEKSKIDAVLALGHALCFLALSPEEKDAVIPDCIHCELLSGYFSSKEAFLENCSKDTTPELMLLIKNLTQTLESLAPEETICFSRNMLNLPGWCRSRELASQILHVINWSEISKHEQLLS